MSARRRWARGWRIWRLKRIGGSVSICGWVSRHPTGSRAGPDRRLWMIIWAGDMRWSATRSGLTVATAWLIARPLVRRANDERVALYTEEREPALEGALLGAVDVASSSRGTPQPLGGHLIAHTVRQLRTLEVPQRIERVHLKRYAAALAGALVLGALIIRLTPSDMRHAAALLAAPWKDASAAAPY